MEISESQKERGRRVRQVLSKNSSQRSASNSAGFDLVPELQDYALGMATLVAQGLDPQLKSYVEYSLNAGWTPEEISEIFVQSISYCGLPKALNGLRVAGEVFKERGVTP